MEAYLESSGTSAVEFFCRNNQRLKAAGYFCKRTPSWIFDRILNTVLPNNLIIARRRSEEKLSTNGDKQGNLGLTLPPNFLHYSNTTKAKRQNLELTPRSPFPWVIRGTKRRSNFSVCTTIFNIYIWLCRLYTKIYSEISNYWTVWFHIVNFSNQSFHILGNYLAIYAYSQKCTLKNFITSFKTALKLERYTNADLKISLYAWLHIKTVPWKFRNLKPKNSRVNYMWRLNFT